MANYAYRLKRLGFPPCELSYMESDMGIEDQARELLRYAFADSCICIVAVFAGTPLRYFTLIANDLVTMTAEEWVTGRVPVL